MVRGGNDDPFDMAKFLAYILAMSLNLNETGVFLAIVIAESALAVLGIIWFKRGTWKEKVV